MRRFPDSRKYPRLGHRTSLDGLPRNLLETANAWYSIPYDGRLVKCLAIFLFSSFLLDYRFPNGIL